MLIEDHNRLTNIHENKYIINNTIATPFECDPLYINVNYFK